MLGFKFALRGGRGLDRFDGTTFEGCGQLGESPAGDVGTGLLVGPHAPKLGGGQRV